MIANQKSLGLVYAEAVDISSTDWTLSAATRAAYGPPDVILNLSNASTGTLICRLEKSTADLTLLNLPTGKNELAVVKVTKTGTAAALATANSLFVGWYDRNGYA